MLHLHKHNYLHMSPSRTQLYYHLCISNVLINTRKSSIQTRDKHKYSLNTTRLITTSDTQLILIAPTIVPTDGEYRHRQAQINGLPPLGTTYQRQRTGNQNYKNRSGEYRTLNLQWRNIQRSTNKTDRHDITEILWH